MECTNDRQQAQILCALPQLSQTLGNNDRRPIWQKNCLEEVLLGSQECMLSADVHVGLSGSLRYRFRW